MLRTQSRELNNSKMVNSTTATITNTNSQFKKTDLPAPGTKSGINSKYTQDNKSF